MASSNNKVTHDFPPFFKVYEDGHVERYPFSLAPKPKGPVPAGLDPETGVQSKDVLISPGPNIKARLFIPELDESGKKLPLVVHYHGGGFCVGSALDVVTKNHLTSIVVQANIIAISVEYRLAPENPLPIAYEDSWAALKWIATHLHGLGPEPWINELVDFGRIYLLGQSAGANMAHYVAIQAGVNKLDGIKVKGALIVHPFFGGKEEAKMYKYMCPTSSGRDDDPKLNPKADPNLRNMGCDKVLVCVAEKDWLKDRGEEYYKTLESSDWNGKLEFYESKGQEHCFHMYYENEEKYVLLNKMVEFILE